MDSTYNLYLENSDNSLKSSALRLKNKYLIPLLKCSEAHHGYYVLFFMSKLTADLSCTR